MKIINEIKLNYKHTKDEFLDKIAKVSHTKKENIDIKNLKILRKSIDARDKKNILFVYNIALDYEDKKILKIPQVKNKVTRPIIVGFGPAGIFASYILTLAGIPPLILERGKCLEDREKDTERFFEKMELDENSNVCFGEGGAGAFSDGKLNTNNKDKDGLYHFVLKTFHEFGAEEKVLYESLPHIGTDKLVTIIKNIRNYLIENGAVISFNNKFLYDEYKKIAENTPIVLAVGNSSRDTFKDLYKNGFYLQAKPFAIGYRVAHKQEMINKSQYGESSNINILGAASYKLTYKLNNNRSIYSFCMCPGGYIINSSNYNGYLSINGMSYNNRNGLYANSAIVETIKVEDYLLGDNNVLNAIKFQEDIEKSAYNLVNGLIPYCSLKDLKNRKNFSINESDIKNIDLLNDDKINEKDIFKGKAKRNINLYKIYDDLKLPFNINEDILAGIQYFSKQIKGFADDDTIIAGVETRTSSPVTLERNEDYMCNIRNFFPCGEGLGHGGGIMSSAVDGIRVAMSIISLYKKGIYN